MHRRWPLTSTCSAPLLIPLLRESTNSNTRTPAFIAIVLLSVVGCASHTSARRWLPYVPIFSIICFFLFFNYSLGLWVATNVFVMSDFLLLPPTLSNHLADRLMCASFIEKLKIGFRAFTSLRNHTAEGVGRQQLARANRSNLPTSMASHRRQAMVQQFSTLVTWQCNATPASK
ncbi:hypothetical protein FA13DRAFT_1727753 [Coprinellus micaceus]|uniref:Uncharacterized protein n=1 Tax=Coprinellus micaceus TaxID=71717 RepID=A0A4Y7TRH5_COPMI|nr:hypothetical protein FA13DRAFT_1727753 [Coprinellus micaceus]